MRQKASIGTGHELTDGFSEEVAEEAIRGWTEERVEELGDQARGENFETELEQAEDSRRAELADDKILHPLQQVLDGMPGSQEELYNELWRTVDHNWLYDRLSHLGTVVAPRVYFAHAALQRLCQLLDEQLAKQFTENVHA